MAKRWLPIIIKTLGYHSQGNFLEKKIFLRLGKRQSHLKFKGFYFQVETGFCEDYKKTFSSERKVKNIQISFKFLN